MDLGLELLTTDSRSLRLSVENLILSWMRASFFFLCLSSSLLLSLPLFLPFCFSVPPASTLFLISLSFSSCLFYCLVSLLSLSATLALGPLLFFLFPSFCPFPSLLVVSEAWERADWRWITMVLEGEDEAALAAVRAQIQMVNEEMQVTFSSGSSLSLAFLSVTALPQFYLDLCVV